MSKTLSFVLILVIVLALIAVWIFYRQPPQPHSGEIEAGSDVLSPMNPPKEPTREKPGVVQPAVQTNDITLEFEKTPKDLTLQERLEHLARERNVSLNTLTQEMVTQWSNAWHQTAEEVNQRIEFYGKAVGEDRVPLQNANVQFGWLAFPEKHFATNLFTDSNGLFVLNNATGVALTVIVNKNGYEDVPGSNQNRFMYYLEGFRSDSNTPVIFYLRKKELDHN